MAGLWVLGLMQLGHLFGGMQSPAGNIQKSQLVVIAQVTRVDPKPDAVNALQLKVLAAPCTPPGFKRVSRLTVVEMGDHVAGYSVGDLAVFPMHPARESPHRPEHVPPDAWTVDQAAQEVVHLKPAEVGAAERLVDGLCKARGDRSAQLHMLIAALASPFPRLAGGAARDLMTEPDPGTPSGEAARTLLGVLSDPARPVGLRVAAVLTAARSNDPALQQAAAERIAASEAPEIVQAAVRGLSRRPDLVDAQLLHALQGPAGPGRMMVIKAAGARRLTSTVAALKALKPRDAREAEARCAALKQLGVPECPR